MNNFRVTVYDEQSGFIFQQIAAEIVASFPRLCGSSEGDDVVAALRLAASMGYMNAISVLKGSVSASALDQSAETSVEWPDDQSETVH